MAWSLMPTDRYSTKAKRLTVESWGVANFVCGSCFKPTAISWQHSCSEVMSEFRNLDLLECAFFGTLSEKGGSSIQGRFLNSDVFQHVLALVCCPWAPSVAFSAFAGGPTVPCLLLKWVDHTYTNHKWSFSFQLLVVPFFLKVWGGHGTSFSPCGSNHHES